VKVRMKVGISGTGNPQTGGDWPPSGGVLTVDDAEGVRLCAGGLAEPVADDKVETAVAPPAEERAGLTTDDLAVPEKRGPGRPRKVG
jgi:hypothetical protein